MDEVTRSYNAFIEWGQELVDEFVVCYADARHEIQDCKNQLDQSFQMRHVHRLFRALHSLKGNCRLMSLEPFARALHHIEDIAAELRESCYGYEPWMGEFIVLAIEEIELQIKELMIGAEDGAKRLQWIMGCIDRVRQCESQDKYTTYCQVNSELRGDIKTLSPAPKAVVLPEWPTDAVFMQGFAASLDGLSVYCQERSRQILKWTRRLNQHLGYPVESFQLDAAVWTHDLGMAFIPHGIFDKEGSYGDEEKRQMQSHVIIGYQLLRRFGGFDEAAAIVWQHHERFDGSGYPQRRKGSDIHVGARILAIVDTYCSITHERVDRSFKRGLLDAIREINFHTGTQFDPELVAVFNDLLRFHLFKGERAEVIALD